MYNLASEAHKTKSVLLVVAELILIHGKVGF
jgi:hypothetical protein